MIKALSLKFRKLYTNYSSYSAYINLFENNNVTIIWWSSARNYVTRVLLSIIDRYILFA